MALPAAALTVLPAYRNVSTLTMRELTLETRDEESIIAFCKAVSVLSAASMCLTYVCVFFIVNTSFGASLCRVILLPNLATIGS